MASYLVRRVLQAIPTLLLLTIVAFAFVTAAPGDVVSAMLDPTLLGVDSRDVLAERRAALGLDRPLPVQYVTWLGHVVRGDLGHSFVRRRPVTGLLLERLWATVQLGGLALGVGILLGVSAGVASAVRQYSALDYTVSIFSYLAWSFPNFYLALILIYVFSVQLQVLPSAGMLTPGVDSMMDRAVHLIMPVTVLSVQFIGIFARQTRSAVLEVMNNDYVRTARSKGLSNRKVIGKHVLVNALIPVITVIGLATPLLITGAIITEIIFSWSGIGSLTVSAINARDYPVVMGIVLMIGVVVVAVNVVVDLMYAMVDPRIRDAM